MSEIIAIVMLLILVVGACATIRAFYGLFAWSGRRKKAVFQLFAIPLGTFALVLFIAAAESDLSDEDTVAAQESESGAEDGTIETAEAAQAEEPPEEPDAAQQLGQWCHQEPIHEAFDQIITIFEQPDGELLAKSALRDSVVDQELERRDGGLHINNSHGEFYILSDDQQVLSLHDGDGLIWEALTHDADDACFRPEGTAAAEREEKAEANACRNDLSCWSEKHSRAATVQCEPPIESAAQFTMEWTDGWFETRLSHMRWADREAGIVTYIGDSARFQNGFGAWQNVIYECDFDTINEVVVGIEVRPGRLN